MPIVKLTTEFLENSLTCPDGQKRRIEYCDGLSRDAVPGLYIEVRATSPGQGTYYQRWKDQSGKTCHSKIGRTTDVDLAAARTKAREIRAQVAFGSDPNAERKANKDAPTLDEFYESTYLPQIKQRIRSWGKTDQRYKKRIKPRFGRKRLTAITRRELVSFLSELRSEGLAPATVNHHAKIIRHQLSTALDLGYVPTNVASRIPMLREDNARERYLSEDELQRLLEVLHTDRNQTVCLVIRMLLSTGARLNEILQATWDDIDQKHSLLRIPISRSKSRKMRSIPLNSSAREVLDQLETTEGPLFIGRRGTQLTTVHKVWSRLRREAGLPDVRLHDLRHTHASMLINSGRTLAEVSAILGHSDPRISARYAHLSVQTLKAASETASAAISRASKPSTTATE